MPIPDPSQHLLSLSSELLLLVRTQDLSIVAVSPAVLHELQRSESELLGQTITSIECALSDVFFWDEVTQGGRPSLNKGEGMYLRGDGTVLQVEKTIWPIDIDGVAHYAIRAHDMTPQQAIEEELGHATSLLRATLESVAEGILVTNLHGDIVNFNHRFADLWHIPTQLTDGGSKEAIYKHLRMQLLKPRRFQSRWQRLLEAHDTNSFDIIEFTDGTVLECRSRPQAHRDQVIGRVFSFTDVTDRIRQERELEAARDAALSASRAKSEFLSQMSHELRTPLNAILGFSDLLQHELQGEQHEAAANIQRAGWHLLELINDVLDLARIEAGKMDLEPEPVPINALFSECRSLLEPLADKYSITLRLHPAVPQLAAQADRRRLKQMMINLISNAIKYNKPAGEVLLTATIAQDQVLLSIQDTGIGLSPDELARLFQPFSRVGQKKKQVEGTGIGLAFSQKLARLMNGDILVQSTAGQGSTFVIQLPIAKGHASSIPSHATGKPLLGGARLLCAEDDPLSRILLKKLLEKHTQLSITMAENGSTALGMALQGQYDLIITDMNLGDMSGCELLQQIRDIPGYAHCPIVALSANAMAEDIREGLALGFTRYLTKPVIWANLEQTLRELLPQQAGA